MKINMDHIVINVVDIEAMLHFYTDILQLHGERTDEFRNGRVPFPSVRLTRDTIIDLFPKKLWERSSPGRVERPNLNHFCLSTDRGDWEELRERLGAHGVAIEDGPAKRWGAHGSGTSIYFRDPEGNLIELRYYDEQDDNRPCLLGS